VAVRDSLRITSPFLPHLHFLPQQAPRSVDRKGNLFHKARPEQKSSAKGQSYPFLAAILPGLLQGIRISCSSFTQRTPFSPTSGFVFFFPFFLSANQFGSSHPPPRVPKLFSGSSFFCPWTFGHGLGSSVVFLSSPPLVSLFTGLCIFLTFLSSKNKYAMPLAPEIFFFFGRGGCLLQAQDAEPSESFFSPTVFVPDFPFSFFTFLEVISGFLVWGKIL